MLKDLNPECTRFGMSPRRTKRLIKDIKAWLKATNTKQIVLAKKLGISPQGLTNILKGRAEPTGEQALAMLEHLRQPSEEKQNEP